MSDTLRLVDLTTEERDYVTALLADDLDDIPLRDERRCALINGIMRKLADALEVTEPWHMMGTRADGAAVGRGSGPIGGCGQSASCTPESTATPLGRIAGYVGMSIRAPLPPDLSDRAEVDLGEFDGVRYVALIPKGPLGPALDGETVDDGA